MAGHQFDPFKQDFSVKSQNLSLQKFVSSIFPEICSQDSSQKVDRLNGPAIFRIATSSPVLMGRCIFKKIKKCLFNHVISLGV